MLEPPSRVEEPQARAFLIERFGSDVGEVEYISEGAWSRCFGFTQQGSELVIRFGRHLEDFQRDRIASRFASRDLPIPQVIEIDAAFGAWYCVSTRAHGKPWEQLDATEWATTVWSVLATFDALRNADISASTGYGEWNHEGMAPHGSWREFMAAVSHDRPESRFHGWKQRLAASPQGINSFDRAYAVMLELVGAFPGPRSLVHNDLLNRNALATGGRVSSLFDWGCSIYGDFVYELATFAFWSPWHVAIEQSDMVAMSLDHYSDMGLSVPNFDARLRCSALHIGLVHLVYNAFLGDAANLRLTAERMTQFLD